MAETDESKSPKESSGTTLSPNSLEVVFASAFAGIASLLKDPGQRTLATALAPPLGYIVVKLGRRLVDVWIPRWATPKIHPPETPESRAKSFIKEAKEDLASGRLTPEEAKRKAKHINKLEEALQEQLLDALQAVPLLRQQQDKPNDDQNQKLIDKQ
jgi:hypothetical protein